MSSSFNAHLLGEKLAKEVRLNWKCFLFQKGLLIGSFLLTFGVRTSNLNNILSHLAGSLIISYNSVPTSKVTVQERLVVLSSKKEYFSDSVFALLQL